MFKNLRFFWRLNQQNSSIENPDEQSENISCEEFISLSEEDILRFIELEIESRIARIEGDYGVSDLDDLLGDACKLVVQHQQASTSLIQRKLRLGYDRAGRIMDQMEIVGVIGSFTGSKAREILFKDTQGLELHLNFKGVFSSETSVHKKKYIVFKEEL